MKPAKTPLFALLTALLLLVILEAFSYAALALLKQPAKTEESLKAADHEFEGVVDQSDPNKKDADYRSSEVIHPFTGFINYPTPGVDPYGFRNDVYSPLQKKQPGRVIIGIQGGSVAYYFWHTERENLIRMLKSQPYFQDKEIVIVNLTLGGGKQPQQLMILNYLLSLGAEFDIIINIDGFNDVAVTAYNYLNWTLFPAFPRDWPLRVNVLSAPTLLQAAGEAAFLKHLRKELTARRGKSALVKVSATARLFYQLAGQWLDAAVYRAQLTLLQQDLSKEQSVLLGPEVSFESPNAALEEAARIWERSSLTMAQICKAKGIAYFHFLQPNQYVPDSKKFTDEERNLFYKEDHVYRDGVVMGYPLLLKAGLNLKAQGVLFTDLVWLFLDVQEAVYGDECCHLNPAGNNRMALAVAYTLLSQAAALPPSS